MEMRLKWDEERLGENELSYLFGFLHKSQKWVDRKVSNILTEKLII